MRELFNELLGASQLTPGSRALAADLQQYQLRYEAMRAQAPAAEEAMRRMQADLQNCRPGGIVRVPNAAQLFRTPVSVTRSRSNCEGCGAPPGRTLSCDYCGRGQ